MLKTVFHHSDISELGYIKATVRLDDVGELLGMGWKLTQEEIHNAKAAKEKEEKLALRKPVDAPADPQGGMEAGSEEWHRNALMELEDKDAVKNYVREVCGEEITKRGTLDTVRERALEAIEASKE